MSELRSRARERAMPALRHMREVRRLMSGPEEGRKLVHCDDCGYATIYSLGSDGNWRCGNCGRTLP